MFFFLLRRLLKILQAQVDIHINMNQTTDYLN